MEDYLDLQAPQWIDFTETCSPVRMQGFFENPHTMHERMDEHCDSTSENVKNVQPTSMTDVTCASIKAQADLDIMKNTPIKVVSPRYRNNKEVVTQITYEQVLGDAMRKLELCKKPLKIREALNKTTQESNVFKTPNMSKIAKSSRSTGCRSVPNKCVEFGPRIMPKSTAVNKSICVPSNDISPNAEVISVSHALSKQDESHSENDTSEKPDNPVDDSKYKKDQGEEINEECNEKNDEKNDVKNEDEKYEDVKKCSETDNEEHNEDKVLKDESEELTNDNKETKQEDGQDNVDAATEKSNRIQSSNKRSVLTWQNHRRSLQKSRMSTNKRFVSLAEAVSRFQNETPERFHTRSNKVNNANMSLNLSKSMQNRLKPTIPISPALVSKKRARPVTVLSREEREKLELEEMKKHQIKANPIPPSVLRGSRIATKIVSVAKKPAAAYHTSTTQSDEKACATSSVKPKNPMPHRDKSSKNTVTKVLMTDSEGLVVDYEDVTFFGVPTDTGVTKSLTRIVPFSFEARNKNLQMKKEQRLKSLQEAEKKSTEFHARPVPNFLKPPTPPAKQQQQHNKKIILPCPFSFHERDKKVFKRKEQLVKQVLEEDKRSRVFRANPVPVFKPVMVRGRSKENLLAKDKAAKTTSEQTKDQENKEPNIDSIKTERKSVQKATNAVCTVDNQKVPLKAYPLKLNTDKRAKDRLEFNEKMRRKEIDEEAKRQEAERKRLESEKITKLELRKLTEVKARPMPTYKPPLVIKVMKQLTDPQSPAFASKRLKKN